MNHDHISAPGPYKKAVILGAGGFLGINLAKELTKKGFDLVCFDRVNSPHWPETATVVTGDFQDLPTKLLQEIDHAYVFHLISSCRPVIGTANAADELGKDLVTTVRYLEVLTSRDIRWIFASSGGTIYGQNEDDQIAESAPTAPICSYGAVKLAIEQYLALYRRLHGIDYVVIRLANPYGPWQDPTKGQGLISTILYRAIRSELVEIWGSGKNVRDYIYLTDAIRGILAAALNGTSGETYNIGTGRGTSICQLIRIVSERLPDCPPRVSFLAGRSVDVTKNVLCSRKLFEHTGWIPAVTVSDGVDLTAQWLRHNLEGNSWLGRQTE